MRYDSLNTVEEVESTTIVGVSHGYKQNEELVMRVTEQLEPSMIAIEDYVYLPHILGSSSGRES